MSLSLCSSNAISSLLVFKVFTSLLSFSFVSQGACEKIMNKHSSLFRKDFSAREGRTWFFSVLHSFVLAKDLLSFMS